MREDSGKIRKCHCRLIKNNWVNLIENHLTMRDV
jgi:hypothetical protein